ncbi:MAG: bifunctional 4-hydroxy-2-oxoglutarate aldolase/2-dehydro-3-deoxy-phosphogluconate aldolase [Hamadaea sp.]|uniref:bifunctional 4-hydroxy-2-oxoglutarate aldolase/2-dehydro-3-deoxy-phosphogluconate aldolase n=1 Tax=Hamadaea sp. TaxID=2024425 RepID=UPI0017FF8BA6|nr:bifunctional 4-hydroxy-2-oxoglutarate aldolase/2-dehydro-3-deoxy-phosphogluconate aldolase [Hamadaea sp.]NUT22441.1 bifunctional 4-hydroxy-2-oxoglutarate aldolase/2-dehydro-3-deoxy-phosphogluconate aldolase [Hamadaea sp.]
MNDVQLGGTRIIPVVALPDARLALDLGQALWAGGIRTIEITLRTPAALAAIASLAEKSDLLVGAGTVLTADQVDAAVDAGAKYVLSPGFSAAVVDRCREVGVPVIPGIATATELQTALAAGITTVKFFPAEQLGGPAGIRALSGPFGQVKFVPTGGVSLANLAGYLAEPAVLAVGASWVAASDLLARRDFAEITRRSAAALELAAR